MSKSDVVIPVLTNIFERIKDSSIQLNDINKKMQEEILTRNKVLSILIQAIKINLWKKGGIPEMYLSEKMNSNSLLLTFLTECVKYYTQIVRDVNKKNQQMYHRTTCLWECNGKITSNCRVLAYLNLNKNNSSHFFAIGLYLLF